ncbi:MULTISPECIES: tetratricopeptide repeat protein [unclassified Rickettsia]|uniref:tetratricopeptide repeat protein n=1 Tax=unclassified Rickettsia TaxID=114295 RepID=UPI000830CAE7|nr:MULTISPECIES: tetratricopeptide repeat protein [unclassified Rickettsia]ODA37407.1 hypothetical protein A8V34_00115 [Rickettsia sp. wq]ODA37838.1 hypothetical protein A8V33_01385 [Rickettsia sp. wb]
MRLTLERDSSNYYAYYYLASALRKQGKFEKALGVIKDRIKRDRSDSFNYFFGSINCVDIYYSTQGLKSKRAIEGAKELIDRALMLTPTDIVYRSQAKLIEKLRKEECDSDARSYNSKGNALYNMGYYEESLICYDKAIKLQPDYAECYYNKANSLYKLRQLEEAINFYDKAINLKPHDARALNNKGNCLYQLGRLEESKNALEEAVSMHPHYAIANHNRRIILRSRAVERVA